MHVGLESETMLCPRHVSRYPHGPYELHPSVHASQTLSKQEPSHVAC